MSSLRGHASSLTRHLRLFSLSGPNSLTFSVLPSSTSSRRRLFRQSAGQLSRRPSPAAEWKLPGARRTSTADAARFRPGDRELRDSPFAIPGEICLDADASVSTTWRTEFRPCSSGGLEVRTRLPKGCFRFHGEWQSDLYLDRASTSTEPFTVLNVQTAPDAGEARASPASGAVWTPRR